MPEPRASDELSSRPPSLPPAPQEEEESLLPPEFLEEEGEEDFEPTKRKKKKLKKIGLGSLAQEARGKQLKQARWILIVVGCLYILIHLVPRQTRILG
jgi:hypothetical protein